MDIPLRSLEVLSAKVARVHGEHNPKLIDLQHALDDLRAALEEGAAPADALARIRSLADDFVAPDWACNSYRALLSGLEDVERELSSPTAA
jgi:regulator of cell morphogenesis and NO signaling